eukprot:m.110559 g.110559  ORF g.110559 m.110559 type:complete len:325 (-) comp12750_c1_seq1:2046-3020(-)
MNINNKTAPEKVAHTITTTPILMEGKGLVPIAATVQPNEKPQVLIVEDEALYGGHNPQFFLEQRARVMSQSFMESMRGARTKQTQDETMAKLSKSLDEQKQSYSKLAKTLKSYKAALKDVSETEHELQAFFASESVHLLGSPGSVMHDLGGCVRAMSKEHSEFADRSVTSMDNLVSTFCNHIVPDTELSMQQLKNIRLAMDAHKSWLNAKPIVKRSTYKVQEVQEELAAHEKSYDRKRRDVVEKILMTDDYRIRTMNEHIPLMQKEMIESVDKLDEIVKSSYEKAVESVKVMNDELAKSMQEIYRPQTQQTTKEDEEEKEESKE